MVRRCTDPKHPSYDKYSKLGMDPRYNPHLSNWEIAIKNFINDNGEIPEGCEIDRIDNNRGYFKDNIQFISHTKNMRKRKCVKLTENDIKFLRNEWNSGKYLTKIEMAEYLDIVNKYHIHKAYIYAILNKKNGKILINKIKYLKK